MLGLKRINKEFGELILKGYSYYAEYIKRYGINASLFIFPGGMGDSYVCCKYYYSNIVKSCSSPVLLVIREASIKVASLFGVSNSELIPYKDRKSVIRLCMFLNMEQTRIEITTPMMNAFYYQIYTKMEGVHSFTELDLFEIMGKKRWGSFLPPSFRSCDISMFDYIKKGKTILLIPYSVSLEPIDIIFWEKLVERIVSLGYRVLTNVNGNNESAVAGSVEMSIPLDILVPFVDNCEFVIGVRSGIFDVMESSSVKRIVLYPRIRAGLRGCGMTSDDSWQAFSLNRWYRNNKVLELRYFYEFRDYIMNTIVENVKNGSN